MTNTLKKNIISCFYILGDPEGADSGVEEKSKRAGKKWRPEK